MVGAELSGFTSVALKKPFAMLGEKFAVALLWGPLIIPSTPQHLQAVHATFRAAHGLSHLDITIPSVCERKMYVLACGSQGTASRGVLKCCALFKKLKENVLRSGLFLVWNLHESLAG